METLFIRTSCQKQDTKIAGIFYVGTVIYSLGGDKITKYCDKIHRKMIDAIRDADKFEKTLDQKMIRKLFGESGGMANEDNTNARLIASAPDLLRACQGVIHHNDGLKAEFKLPNSLIRQVTQAINKTEGE